jgi:hypothetical protein
MKGSLKYHLTSGVILAGLSFSVQTGLAGPQETGLKITLSVHNDAPIKSEMLVGAKQEVTRIYRKIGVEAVWLDRPSPTETPQDSFRQEGPDIVLIIVAHPMAEAAAANKRSLGMSPGAGRIRNLAYVFYDKVEDLYRTQTAAVAARKVHRWATTAQILGYAMAHETGHLLGLSHSSIGIMREGWRWNDLLDAAYGDLGFTPQQAAEIRMEVRIRKH